MDNSWKEESGSAGLRILIFIYAFGIVAIALQPFREYWAPYVHDARVKVHEYTSWGEPPRRGEHDALPPAKRVVDVESPVLKDEKARTVVENPAVEKEREREVEAAAKRPPMEKVHKEDKQALQSLLDGMGK